MYIPMAHSLTPLPATSSWKNTHLPFLGFRRVWASHHAPHDALDQRIIGRRDLVLGLGGALVGLTNIGNQNASAAARRPPPPPPEEKKDPNVSGVLAKVLASKKRKEAMKEEVAKLRERGKSIDGQ
ncbi:hypothetical protein U1Q18_024919 [Sarracenia purpurea var. burkii]